MSDIAIIDAEIIERKNHYFPNLVCMKLSAYHKQIGDNVCLKLDYDELDKYDTVYISKVFIKTKIPYEPLDDTGKSENSVREWYENNPILNLPNVKCGGTGFFYDKSPKLDVEIEHIMPDYHLYDNWVKSKVASGQNPAKFKYYTDYSIGYITRGCFRKCEYCVNRNYDKCEKSSKLQDFLDESRPKICLLDDNFFAYPKWEEEIELLMATGKRFKFNQGLDERLLTKHKIESIARWNYDGDLIFAFDNIADKELIVSKLEMLNKLAFEKSRRSKFYVLCGYDRHGNYDEQFWHQDILDTFERISILDKFGALPYIMRHESVYSTKYSGIYSAIASWCNQPNFFRKVGFEKFCIMKGMGKYLSRYKNNADKYLEEIGKKYSTWKYMEQLDNEMPDIRIKYSQLWSR